MCKKILFSNIGYARGIDGSLGQTVRRALRYLYCRRSVQEDVLRQLRGIIDAAKPDICCLVEIDQGSLHSDHFNQVEALVDETYAFHDVADKYGEGNKWKKFSFLQGRSNAFLSNKKIPFERFYFKHGTKRLMYRLHLQDKNIHVFFSHFSLNKEIRALQFVEAAKLIAECGTEAVLLADFNIFDGFTELEPLMRATGMKLLNREDEYTFTFHKRKLALDLCLCSGSLAERVSVKVIDQPFSDHKALLVNLNPETSALSSAQ